MPDDWEIIEPDDDWEIEDQYDPNLAGIRASFKPELEIPQARELLAASTIAEVGDQPLHVQKAYIESVFNRAAARNKTVTDTVLDPDYYPGITHQRMFRKMGNFQDEEMQQLDSLIEDVVKGSNVSRYATGNESLDVHSGGAPVSYNPRTGERFVQENDDRGWVEKTASEPKDWEVMSASGKTAAQPDDWEIIPPAAGEKKPYFATREEEQRMGGKGPNYPAEGVVEPKSEEAKLKEPAYPAKQSPEGLIDNVEAGINAAKEWWQTTGKKNWESTEEGALRRGLRISTLGLGETINRYAYSPIVHGIREAIDYIAPDSSLAKTAKKIDDEFYKHTVAIPAAQREALQQKNIKEGTASELVGAVGTMLGDLPIIAASGALAEVKASAMVGGLELKAGMELVNTLRHGAAAMTIPAMRTGTDAAEEVKKKGGSEMEQFGAFVRATGIQMGIGAIPMATTSAAPTVARRLAERAVKSIPLASAAVESGRMLDNAVSDIFGGQKRPFSLAENIKGTLPLALMGGVAGRSTAKSKFERTFGFSPTKMDKVEFMRARADAEGLAKVTPEKVMEWDAEWKKQEGVFPEEVPAPLDPRFEKFAPKEGAAAPEAKTPAPEVKRSAQALGIVADPRSQKGFQALHDEAKNIAEYLNKAEHWGPYNSAVGHNVAAEQKALDNVIKQSEALKKEVPDELARQGMTMYREAGGNMKKIVGWGANVKDAAAKAAYRAAGALKPSELAALQKISDRFSALNKWLNLNGINVAEIENYVTHMFHHGGLDPTTGMPNRSLSSFFKYAKQRHYDSYFQAFQAGEKPKTLDIVDILSAYELLGQRAVNNKKFVDRLKVGQARDGNPIVGRASTELRHLGYKTIENVPGLDGLLVHPDHIKHLSRILGRSRIAEWLDERGRNPFANVAKAGLQALEVGQKYTKGTMFSFSLFHQITEGTHALGHRVNPFNLKTKTVDLNDPEQYDAAVHGLMLRPDRASQEQFIQGSGVDNYNLVTKFARKFGGDAGKGVADFIDSYSHYLFEDWIPRLKMDTYLHILERNMDRFAGDLESGKMTPSAVKSLSADQANAAYGHLNYTKMGRSRTVQHAYQLAFLAPDFFEARARFVGQAAVGFAGKFTGSKLGAEQFAALARLAIGQYVAARLLNQLDHGDPEWDPEHAFEVMTDLNGLLPDKRWIGLRSVPEDMIKAGLVSLAKGDINKAVGEAGRFIDVRFAAIPRLATDNIFKYNWKGEKTNFGKSLTDLLTNIVPMPAQGYVNQLVRPNETQSISSFEGILKSTGAQIHRVSPINDAFQMAEDWMKVNDREEYDRRQASSFPASKYRGLRYALEDSDWEAARTWATKLREGGATTETFQQSLMRPFTRSLADDQRLYKSLDKHDQALFDAALERRVEVLKRYRQHVNSRAPVERVTKETLHRKMREAEIEDAKEERKKRAHAL